MSPERVAEILSRIAELPGTAVLPVAVVAVHDGVDQKTVRRNYPLVELSPGRLGVQVSFLRSRKRRESHPMQAMETSNPAA
jgi:hypothetical protein